MITEDQLEQLAIQWFQDTGWNYVHGAVIAPEGVAAEREERGNIEHRTLNIEHRSEEKRSLAEAVLRMGRPLRAWNPVGDGTQGVALGCRVMPRWGFGKERGKPLNKERRYPIALTMRGPWESGLAQFMGIPWARRIGVRRSLGKMPRWGGGNGKLRPLGARRRMK